jgi:hypothetical protein
MTATEWAAWVGACSGLGGLGWNIYTKLTSGPKLRVRAAKDTPIEGDWRLTLTVQNVGTGPTTITELAFRRYLSRLARLWNRPTHDKVSGYIHKSPDRFMDLGTKDSPYTLNVGGEFVVNITLAGESKEWLSSGQLWCGVVHSFSKKPALAKISRPKE